MNVVAFTDPATSSFSAGLVVPIPMLPMLSNVKKSSVSNVFPLVIVNLPVDLSIPIPNSICPSVSKDIIESSASSVPELWISSRIGAAKPFFSN